MQPSIAVAWSAAGQIAQLNPQFCPIVSNTLVPMAGAGIVQGAASTTLAHLVNHPQPLHQNSTTNGLQSFFDNTS
jgi:hypothetical protein